MRTPSSTPLKFLNLWQIRFPIGAIASIAHRVSGVLLLIALPLLASVLARSLQSPAEFDALRAAAASTSGTLILALATWALAHHVLAGIRHLLMDIGIGSGLAQARRSARAALIAAPIIALYVLVRGAMVRLFSGQRAWVAQRFTAVMLLAAVLAGVAWLLLGEPLDYARWRALVTTPVGAVLTVLVFAMLAVHGWVGARDIVLDYVQPRGLRLALLGAILLILAATLIRVVLVLATHGAT